MAAQVSTARRCHPSSGAARNAGQRRNFQDPLRLWEGASERILARGVSDPAPGRGVAMSMMLLRRLVGSVAGQTRVEFGLEPPDVSGVVTIALSQLPIDLMLTRKRVVVELDP